MGEKAEGGEYRVDGERVIGAGGRIVMKDRWENRAGGSEYRLGGW